MIPKEAPALYSEWAAVTAISGALERRCWFHGAKGDTYPNLYVWLVGYPGVGKSIVIKPVAQLWNDSGTLNTASESITGKGLFDEMLELSGVGRVDIRTQTWEQYSSLLIALPEFGTFLQTYDGGLINFLNDLYDCGPHARDRTRGGGFKKIENPHLVILAGTQPGYIQVTFPKEAFELGLTSRTIMVWGEEVAQEHDIFDLPPASSVQYKDLLHDLRIVSALAGQFEFDGPAKAVLRDWKAGGYKPRPEHPKLLHYLKRRLINTLKISMCLSAAESDDLLITAEHAVSAIDLLLRTEEVMPNIFKAMVSTETEQDLQQILERLRPVAKNGIVRREQVWIAMVTCGIKPHFMPQVLQSLVESKALVEAIPGEFKLTE